MFLEGVHGLVYQGDVQRRDDTRPMEMHVDGRWLRVSELLLDVLALLPTLDGFVGAASCCTHRASSTGHADARVADSAVHHSQGRASAPADGR